MKEKPDSKKNRTMLILMAVALLVIVLAIAYLGPSISFNAEKPLTGVLMNTGDLYFGRLSYFPRLALEDVYVVQAVSDPSSPDKPLYQVVPLSASVWSPDKIYLNYDNIVFIGNVGEGSQVMQAINNQGQ
jgi:hypothetical protein